MGPRSSTRFGEIWVRSPEGASLYALINGDRGWLMFLREDGDSGFTSYDPAYTGPHDAMIGYRLENGQQDLYPAAWALPLALVHRALQRFEQTGQRPPFVTWRAG